MNSNAGYTRGIRQLCEAGLQNLRVTIFSSREEDYRKYHRPERFGLRDVADSIACAKDHGVYVSINLLTFPGFTDRPLQLEALHNFIQKTGVDMIQIRNLNIDPDRLMKEFPSAEPGIGIVDFLYRLQNAFPGLRLGSFNHPHPGAI
jgi:molybdenum cofactor biosynthesis enzyme MoaA